MALENNIDSNKMGIFFSLNVKHVHKKTTGSYVVSDQMICWLIDTFGTES